MVSSPIQLLATALSHAPILLPCAFSILAAIEGQRCERRSAVEQMNRTQTKNSGWKSPIHWNSDAFLVWGSNTQRSEESRCDATHPLRFAPLRGSNSLVASSPESSPLSSRLQVRTGFSQNGHRVIRGRTDSLPLLLDLPWLVVSTQLTKRGERMMVGWGDRRRLPRRRGGATQTRPRHQIQVSEQDVKHDEQYFSHSHVARDLIFWPYTA